MCSLWLKEILSSSFSPSPPFSLDQEFGSMDKWLKVYVSFSGLVVEVNRINNRFEMPTSNTENDFMFVPLSHPAC